MCQPASNPQRICSLGCIRLGAGTGGRRPLQRRVRRPVVEPDVMRECDAQQRRPGARVVSVRSMKASARWKSSIASSSAYAARAASPAFSRYSIACSDSSASVKWCASRPYTSAGASRWRSRSASPTRRCSSRRCRFRPGRRTPLPARARAGSGTRRHCLDAPRRSAGATAARTASRRAARVAAGAQAAGRRRSRPITAAVVMSSRAASSSLSSRA